MKKLNLNNRFSDFTTEDTEFHGGKIKFFTTNSYLQYATNGTNLNSGILFLFVLVRVGSWLTLLFFFIGIFFTSCASAPRVSLPEGLDGTVEDRELYTLPSGGRAYIWMNTAEARPLLGAFSIGGLSDKDMTRILDSTETAIAVVFPEGQDRRFFLTAKGNFPVFSANLSLTFNRDWKRLKSPHGGKYWYSQSNGIALALESKQAMVSNIDPFSDLISETPPTGFVEFRRDFALAGWMPNPSDTVNRVISSMGVPLSIPAVDFFFGASPHSPDPASTDNNPTDDNPMNMELWAPVFKIRTPSASNARSLLALFSVARLFIPQGLIGQGAVGSNFRNPQEAAALLFANAPEQDEDFITFRIASLDAASIALLFQIFSIY